MQCFVFRVRLVRFMIASINDTVSSGSKSKISKSNDFSCSIDPFQVYVSEISHPEIRGCLSAVLKMAGQLGTLCSYTLGAFLDWRQLAAVAAVAPILFFLAILPIPETPSFLLYHGREEEASKSMAWLRSRGEDVASEIETLRSNILTKEKSIFPKFSSQLTRPLFITCGLMFFHKFSGVTVFTHYAVPIFKHVSFNFSFNLYNK